MLRRELAGARCERVLADEGACQDEQAPISNHRRSSVVKEQSPAAFRSRALPATLAWAACCSIKSRRIRYVDANARPCLTMIFSIVRANTIAQKSDEKRPVGITPVSTFTACRVRTAAAQVTGRSDEMEWEGWPPEGLSVKLSQWMSALEVQRRPALKKNITEKKKPRREEKTSKQTIQRRGRIIIGMDLGGQDKPVLGAG